MARLCRDRFGRVYRCSTAWSGWGRWVLAAGLIIFVILLVACCFSSRRRRSAGRKPYYGTGWTSRMPGMRQNGQYQPEYNNVQQPYMQQQYMQQPHAQQQYSQQQYEQQGPVYRA